MCSVGVSCASPQALAGALDEKQRRDLADTLLDRREPDELAI
jgi:hypothetical protein